MNCPNCLKTKLEKTERLGFHFIYCPSCNGMWFERAELNKVLDRLYSDEATELKQQSIQKKSKQHSEHESAITKQIYENREMHYHHEHPNGRHWLHHLFR